MPPVLAAISGKARSSRVSLVLVSDGPQGLAGYLDFAHLDFVAIEITGCDDHFEGKKITNKKTYQKTLKGLFIYIMHL